MKPYIGVTGFTNSNQANEISKIFKQNLPEDMTGMFGILLSYSNLLNPDKEMTSKWANRYAKLKDMPQILKNIDSNFFPALHYYTKGNFYEELRPILPDLMKKGLKGVQLNIAWPNEEYFKNLTQEFPNLKIIFQISKRATENKTQSEIVSKLDSYGSDFDYCLFDMSEGGGTQKGHDKSFEFYKECKKQEKHIDHVFVGGLSPENVGERIKEIYSKGIHKFGTDAEGQLMDETGILSTEKVSKYIVEASNAFKNLKT